jgi:hypothetical protein
VFTPSRHLSLSQARWIQSTLHDPNLILSSHLRLGLPICFFFQVPTTKSCMRLFYPLLRATFPVHLIIFHYISTDHDALQHALFSSHLLPPAQIPSSAPYSRTPSTFAVKVPSTCKTQIFSHLNKITTSQIKQQAEGPANTTFPNKIHHYALYWF